MALPERFLIVFCATAAVMNSGTASDALLPHSSCTLAPQTDLFCIIGNYSNPGNLDLSLIPNQTQVLRLGSFNADFSIIHDTAAPLSPVLTNLTTLDLRRFTGTNGTRLPIESFLINVRERLTELTMYDCRLEVLGSNFLRGFRNLEVLGLAYNDLMEIDVDAFETRISLEDSTPLLWSISLNTNFISTLDWSVFAPVAEYLVELNLGWQQQLPGSGNGGANQLTLSKPFKFANLTQLSLRSSSLGFLSRAILNTFNINQQSVIDLDENAFCVKEYNEGCSCCEAQEFVQWAHEVNDASTGRRPSRLSFTCGGYSVQHRYYIFPTNATLPLLSSYECCSNSTAPGCSSQTTSAPHGCTPDTGNTAIVLSISFVAVFFSTVTAFGVNC